LRPGYRRQGRAPAFFYFVSTSISFIAAFIYYPAIGVIGYTPMQGRPMQCRLMQCRLMQGKRNRPV
jgi:hypothetical protein